MNGFTAPVEKLQRCLRGSAHLWSFLLLLPAVYASAQERPHAIAVYANIISASKLFTAPLSQDLVEKNNAEQFGTILNARVAYSYSFTPMMRLQLSGELVEDEDVLRDNNGTDIADGYRLYAAELAGLFVLPFTGKTFALFIGGGGGVYWGTRKYAIAGITADPLDSSPSFNILTVIGAEYFFSDLLSLAAEWRFRDPVVTAKNAFTRASVESYGITYPLEQRPFTSKINVNGNTYSLGVCFHL
jgi:hypothetical protein